MNVRAICLLVLVLLSIASPCAARRHREPSTGLQPIHFGQRPPDFAFDDGSGPTRLDLLVGTAVVINFWATWCHPCVEETATLARLQQTYGRDVRLITITNEAPGVARRFLAGRKLRLPVIEDAGKIFQQYGVTPVPVTIVLSRDGTVAYVSLGQLGWEDLHAAVDWALANNRS